MPGPKDKDWKDERDYKDDKRENDKREKDYPAPTPMKDKMVDKAVEDRPPTTPEGGQWPTPAEKAKTEADKLKAEKEAEAKAAAEAKKAAAT